MIPISICKYKKIESKETIAIEQKEAEKPMIVDSIENLNEKVKTLEDSNDYDYASILIKEDIDIKGIVNIEMVSKIYQVEIGKIRAFDIYLFAGRNPELLKYMRERCYELIEVKLYTERFEKVIEDYKKLFGVRTGKGLKKLMEKNRFYLPLLRELDKKLNLIKDLAKEENNPLGFFASSLREIREEHISTLEAWISISFNYIIGELTQKTNKKILYLTIIMAALTLLAFIDKILPLFQKLLKIL